jgi:hypothetical protein
MLYDDDQVIFKALNSHNSDYTPLHEYVRNIIKNIKIFNKKLTFIALF